MKYFLLLLFFFPAFVLQSQTLHDGIKADLNLSNINGNGNSTSYTGALQAGAFSEISLNKKWGL